MEQGRNPAESPTGKVGLFNRFFKKHGIIQDQQVTSEELEYLYDDFQRVPAGAGSECISDQHSPLDGPSKFSQHVSTGVQQYSRHQLYGCSSSVPATPAAAELCGSKPVLHGEIPEATAAKDSLAPGNARPNALSDPGQPQETQQLQKQQQHDREETPPAYVDGMPPPGQRSSNGSINEPGASVWLHEAFANLHSCASSPVPMHRSVSGMRSGGKVCSSMEDMYKMIFEDGPTDSSCVAASPCPSGPVPNRQGSIASMGSCSSHPHQIGCCSSNSILAGGTPAAQHVSGSFGSVGDGCCQLDDLVPAGLAKLKITGRHSGCSDAETGNAGFFLPHSSACSSNGNIGPAWPEVPSGKSPVSAGNRGSPRYGLRQAGSNSSPAASADNRSPTHQQQLQRKRLWERRQAAHLDGSSSSGSRSATASPSLCIGGGVWRTHSTPARQDSSLADLAAQLGAADSGTTYGSNSSRSGTPMSHSYSNPDIVAGNLPPACARSLFGSVPLMDRPLGSSSWLARADSSLMDDHLSVASDDEYIREVNAENVLSSAWGPSHAKRCVAFKYCDATSPLNHPGRASPFIGSPFASPRGSRDVDFPPLRAAAASGVVSCPGSPLGGNCSNSGTDDAAALQRHRHPFGICPPDVCYKPSPLQQKQQHGYQEGGEQQQAANQQRLSNSGNLGVPDGISQYNGQAEAPDATKSRCTRPSEGTPEVSAALSAEAENEGIHTARSVSSSIVCSMLAGQHVQHASIEPTNSREPRRNSLDRRPSSTLGRAGAAPAAAVSALMTGWGGVAVTANSGSSSPVCQPRYSARHTGGQAAAAAGIPKLALRNSTSSSSAEAAAGSMMSTSRRNSSEFCKPAGIAAAAAAVAADAGLQTPQPQPSSSSSPSSFALHRSRSVPMPGTVANCSSGTATSHNGTPPVRAGFFNTLASYMSLPGSSIIGQLAPNGTSAAGNGMVPSPASSTELLLPPHKPTAGDSPGRRGSRRQSRGFSSSSFSNPSRLSQSSAAGESADAAGGAMFIAMQATRTSSTGSSPAFATAVNNMPDMVEGVSTSSLQVSPSPDKQQQPMGLQQNQQHNFQQEETHSSFTSVRDSEFHRPSQRLDDKEAATAAVPICDRTAVGVAAADAGSISAPIGADGASAVQDVSGDADSANNSNADGGIEASDLALTWVTNGTPTAQRCSSLADNVTAHQQQAAAMPSLPEVDFIERIGRGSFGEVFRGVWCGSVVAVKVIKVRQQAPISRLAAGANALRSPAAAQNSSRAWSADPSSRAASLCDDSGGSSSIMQQQLQADAMLCETNEHEQQVAKELAQHEYESWLNANLRHPNIVQLFTSFTVVLEDRPPAALMAAAPEGGWGCSGLSWKTHLVMEYCELGTMQAVLQRGMFMNPQAPALCNALWVLATAKELCAALAYLHSMDVVHGDLKSSNVLLKAAATTAWDSRGFVAKVSDFGLSKVMDAISAANGGASSSTANSTCGDSATAAASGAPLGQWPVQQHFGALTHAAPELIRGEELSKASDVYSVGVLLWELVTGQAPFYGLHPGQLLNAKLTHPTSQLLRFPDAAPAALVSLCLSCWDDKPVQRPSMAGVVEKLNGIAVDLLGEDQAVITFPDIARVVSAQRRSAAEAATAAAQQGQSMH